MAPYREARGGAPWLQPEAGKTMFARFNADMADVAPGAGVTSRLFTLAVPDAPPATCVISAADARSRIVQPHLYAKTLPHCVDPIRLLWIDAYWRWLRNWADRMTGGGTDNRGAVAKSAMTLMIAISATVFALGWTAGYQHKKYKVKQALRDRPVAITTATMRRELADIKLLTERLEPRLVGEGDPSKIAKLLRNMIYERVPWITDPRVRFKGFDWLDLADTYRKSLLDPTYGHMCGGRTIQFLVALRAFGLTARKAGIYPEVVGLPDIANSHASVEVLIDGLWVAEDPTFNFSLVDTAGRQIGWLEAARLLKNGQPVTHRSDGFVISQDHSLELYAQQTGLKLSDVTKYVNTSPYWDGISSQRATRFPEEWDGQLVYTDGRVNPVFLKDSRGIYELLSRPLN